MIRTLARSMRWKLALASLLVQALMLAVLVWNGIRLMDARLAEQAEARVSEVSLLLNASIGPLLARQDYAPIADILRENRRRDGIEYFILTDNRGRLVLAEGWDAATPPPAPQPALDVTPDSRRFDASIPIILSGQTYGHLAFGLSTRFIAEARRNLLRDSLFIAAPALAASLALLVFLAFWLTRHLKRLENASKSVSAGNFDIRLPVSTQDEVGRVTSAFRSMAGEIKRQLDALQASEARFRSLLDLSTDWYWEQDAHYRFTRHQSGRLGSPGALPVPDPIGRCRWDFPTTLSAAEWAAHRERLEGRETFRDLEYGIVQPDGRIRHILVCGEPVFDGEGRFTGYRGTASDITDRKQTEASLRLAGSVFAEAREGIIITGPDWRIADINPMAQELTGYRKEELLGHSLLELFAETRDAAFLEATFTTLVEKGHWRGETWGRRKSGERFPELLTASAVRDAKGVTGNYLFLFSDITALKEHQHRLEQMAHYDALTRLPNRVLLGERLATALAQAARSEEILAVAYLDLDGFKPVNDTLGHDAGDALLVEVASRLSKCIRTGDTVARLGGDEFVLLLHAADPGECETALARVLETMARPYTVKGRRVELSGSIGVARYPTDATDPDALLRNADQAMYVAKQTGRNRYHFFDTEHDRRVRAHSEQIARIRAALPAGEFVLFYQPKVDMRRGRVIGAEALIRWQHPEAGLVPPGEFLPVVENTDFAIPLGEWVIAAALDQMVAWRAQGLDLPVSVNVSARQLQAPDFVDRLQAVLAAHPDFPPNRLELEIVETAALDDIQYVNTVISRCQELGVDFALDDFGTGYSSLTYFKRLPARTLKVDQSFVRDMLVDPEDLAIVEGVIGLARAFHRVVIAEGVETAEHGVRLLEMGCDLAQGYGIARPMPADQVPAWVAAFRPDPRWPS